MCFFTNVERGNTFTGSKKYIEIFKILIVYLTKFNGIYQVNGFLHTGQVTGGFVPI